MSNLGLVTSGSYVASSYMAVRNKPNLFPSGGGGGGVLLSRLPISLGLLLTLVGR